MKQAIAIFHPASNDDTTALAEIFDSIHTSYPIMITAHKGFQIDAVRQMFRVEARYDEIFFIQETMVVKDNSVWDLIFDGTEGKSVTFNPDFQMFLAKYRREVVENIPFPVVKNRAEDIEYGEGYWNFSYRDYEANNTILLDPMIDPNPDLSENHEWKYGRDNIVVENNYFKKWKSVWNINMLTE